MNVVAKTFRSFAWRNSIKADTFGIRSSEESRDYNLYQRKPGPMAGYGDNTTL